jgi:hypothetical protein
MALTIFHLSCEGLRQRDAPTTVYFNVLTARVYKKHLVLLSGRKVLFAIADVVKILAPPALIKELEECFPTITWEEVGLATQTIKNLIYVHPSARATWGHCLDSTPRNLLTELLVHDIPDGSDRVDPFDLESKRI